MIKCWRFLSVPAPVITGNAVAPTAGFSLWTHRRRREHNQRCWSLGGWWLRSGRCHCLSCWARWRWAPSPPRSSGRGREVLPRPLSISRDPALEVREKGEMRYMCLSEASYQGTDGEPERIWVTYEGLPWDTHSSFKYWPSWGTARELMISTLGASSSEREGAYWFEKIYVKHITLRYMFFGFFFNNIK